jgi:hypothetical protein
MIDVRHDALTHEHDPLPREVAHLAQTDAEGKEMEDKLSEEAKMKIGDTGRHAPTPMG